MSNDKAIPGWKLVPVEPTDEMLVDGFESAPCEGFTPLDEWEKYDAMSGCQQAVHRARLCYAAMLQAAPPSPQPVAESVKLESIEQYRMQMAAISTAAIGYCTPEDGTLPEYITPALRDVQALYAKYAALHAAALQPVARLTDADIDALADITDHEMSEGDHYYGTEWQRRFARAIEAHLTGNAGATGESNG